jgi:ATP-dependent helicase HrpA
MTALGLGDVAAFPFIDPPDRRNVTAGIQLLEELGACGTRQLTPLGRQLAQLPIDPRLARMVIEADRNGCVREVLVIAAALSIQDPRERPAEKQQAADEKHGRFADPTSDFLTYLNLWNHLQEQQKQRTSSGFPADVPRRVPQLPAGARVAGPVRPAEAGRPDARHRRPYRLAPSPIR